MKKGEVGDWNEAAASQRMPELLEAVRDKDSPLEPLAGTWSYRPFDFEFLASRTI